jgi:hypothetical protein
LFYTKSGAKILLVEENKIFCWNSGDMSLCFITQGNFVGVSDDEKVILLLSDQGVVLVDSSSGIELDKTQLKDGMFRNDQRSIISTALNSDQLIIKDVFGILPARQITLLGKMEFYPPVRTWNSEYVVVRTWYDDGWDGEWHECYNMVNKRKVFHGPGRSGFNMQVSHSTQKNIFAIHECSRIFVYDLMSGYRIYDIHNRDAPYDKNGLVMRGPRKILDISLYPLAYNLLAVAVENEIRLMAVDYNCQLYQAWESGMVLGHAQKDDPFKNISFSPDGRYIAWISSRGELTQRTVDFSPSILASVEKENHQLLGIKIKIEGLRETDQIDMLIPSQEGIENGIELLIINDEEDMDRLFVDKLNNYAGFVFGGDLSKKLSQTKIADVLIRVVYIIPPSDAMRKISTIYYKDNPAQQIRVVFQDAQSYREMIEAAHFREQLSKLVKNEK